MACISLLPAQVCCSTQIRAVDGRTAGWKLTGCQPSPALCNEGAGVGDCFLGEAEKQWKKPCPI